MRRSRLLWSLMVAAKHSYATHVSLMAYYPHHPFNGQTVTVVHRSVSFGLYQALVIILNDYQLVTADWMLDEERCRGMDVVAHPIVVLSDLMTPRSLLDALHNCRPPLLSVRHLQKHLRLEVLMSPPFHGVVPWREVPNTPTPQQTTQTHCRKLLSHMLLASVSGATEEESDE